MFYTFRQNNSYGVFDIDDKVASHVIIEAPDSNFANHFAEKIGIYFDGVEKDIDCPCCGNRWNEVNSYDGDEEPILQGKPVKEFLSHEYVEFLYNVIDKKNVYCYVYYMDGRVESYTLDKKGE